MRGSSISVLLLSDTASDIREVLAGFPLAPYEVKQANLKSTNPEDLIPLHPDLILVDATHDTALAEEAARRLSLAWEIGLPPIIVVVDQH